MKTYKIFKYPIDHQISVPGFKKFLMVDVQRNIPTVWILCDPTGPTRKINFKIVATGEPIHNPDEYTYVDSWQEDDRTFIWHLFVYPNQEPT